jgi:RND family efflux transporter MFP subunit
MKFSLLSKLGLMAIPVIILAVVINQQIKPIAKVGYVTRGTAIDAIPGTIEVSAEVTMDLRSEVGGRVVESNLKEGLQVKAGDLLVQLDTEGLELERENILVRIRAIEERLKIGNPKLRTLKNMEEDYEVFERQAAEGTYSRNDLERRKRELDTLKDEITTQKIADEEQLEAEKIQLRTMDRRIRQARVVAPIDGVITDVFAYTGDLIGPSVPLARIISLDRRIEARISEENFSGIQPGQPALVRLLSYQRQTFPGEVLQVLDAADPLTQKYTLFLTVDIDQDLLIPGLTGEVSITRGRRVDSLLIPRRALRGNLVFVVGDDNVVEVRNVEPGYVSLNHAEILNGLNEGERVIVDGHERFRDGDRVRAAE